MYHYYLTRIFSWLQSGAASFFWLHPLWAVSAHLCMCSPEMLSVVALGAVLSCSAFSSQFVMEQSRGCSKCVSCADAQGRNRRSFYYRGWSDGAAVGHLFALHMADPVWTTVWFPFHRVMVTGFQERICWNKYCKRINPNVQVFVTILLIKGSHILKPTWRDTERYGVSRKKETWESWFIVVYQSISLLQWCTFVIYYHIPFL